MWERFKGQTGWNFLCKTFPSTTARCYWNSRLDHPLGHISGHGRGGISMACEYCELPHGAHNIQERSVNLPYMSGQCNYPSLYCISTYLNSQKHVLLIKDDIFAKLNPSRHTLRNTFGDMYLQSCAVPQLFRSINLWLPFARERVSVNWKCMQSSSLAHGHSTELQLTLKINL